MLKLEQNLYDIKELGKFYLFENDYITDFIKKYGAWEAHLVFLFKNIIKPDFIVMDIGAHIGIHTICLSKLAKIVYAFEPMPSTFSLLEKNISINQCLNITPICIGLLDKPCIMSNIFVPKYGGNTGCTRFFDNCDLKKFPQQKLNMFIKVESLDNWYESNKIERLDLLKIDIEESEEFFLKGAIKTIQKFKPIIIMEKFFHHSDVLLDIGYIKRKIHPEHADYIYTKDTFWN